MKFEAFECTCGYKSITPEENPLCSDCGKPMTKMDRKSNEYKKFDSEVKGVLGL